MKFIPWPRIDLETTSDEQILWAYRDGLITLVKHFFGGLGQAGHWQKQYFAARETLWTCLVDWAMNDNLPEELQAWVEANLEAQLEEEARAMV